MAHPVLYYKVLIRKFTRFNKAKKNKLKLHSKLYKDFISCVAVILNICHFRNCTEACFKKKTLE